MSIARAALTRARNGSRWLLLGSLALNLFFIGIALALAIRAPKPSRWHPDVFVRTERLAATLPAADAAILRARMEANRAAIANAQIKYSEAREDIREAMRQQPFDAKALDAAMAETRAARQNFDLVVHGAFSGAAAAMSAEGRQGLAARRSSSKPKKTGDN